MIKGIDVSAWQGNIDFNQVKADGIKFAIIKAGGSDSGFYMDKWYLQNVVKAKSSGVDIGAYYIVGSKCKSSADGLADAMRFEEMLGKYPATFTYPVYIDFEIPNATNKQGNTDAVYSFCEYMEKAGYYAGIYASDISGFKDRLYLDQLKRFDKWVARYGSEPKYAKPYGIWQSSSKGNISGINGHVDLDYSLNDYPTIIKSHHLNGF